jgi:transmembrane protein EpsG
MIAAFLFFSFSVLFAFLEDRLILKNGLKVSVALIFVFLSLRYDYGNDYMHYFEKFRYLKKYNTMDDFYFKGIEFGWYYLNLIFQPLGFFTLIAAISAFLCIVLYAFVKKYVPKNYYWAAIFVFLFQPYNLLVLVSAIRQSITVGIFLCSINYIVKRNLYKYILTILFATLFHTSAIFLLPIYFLSCSDNKIDFSKLLIYGVIFVLPFFYLNSFFAQFEMLISLYFNDYISYTLDSETKTNFGAGFFLNISLYIIILYLARFEKETSYNKLYKITLISLVLIPVSFIIPILGRLNFYLSPIMMCVFPLTITKIKSHAARYIFMATYLFFTVYQFVNFFLSEVWSDYFIEYKTIFSTFTI